MYSLKKSRAIFFYTLKLFRKKRKKITATNRTEIHNTLSALQDHLMDKEREEAFNAAKKCELLTKIHMKRNGFDRFFEIIFAIIFALAVAVVVRQMWFELYQIPSGSMRPTLKEQDRLFVSKTQFGINVPLMLKHFTFEPDQIKRNGIFIFTGEEMDIPDNRALYFYLFPGYKQYIKRLMGKPGDILYFYGGQIFGIDKDGRDITEELQPTSLETVHHVPIMNFSGKTKMGPPGSNGISSPVILYQMNQPVAKMYLSSFKKIKSEILYSAEKKAKPVSAYSDLWGMKNYAIAEIVHDKGEYRLKLNHSPSLKNAILKPTYSGKAPALTTTTSYIPLDSDKIKHVFNSMITARFVVKNGFIRRQSTMSPPIKDGIPNHYPKVTGIPNGTYEFFDGQAHRIYWFGLSKKLSSNHPLMQYSPEKTALFFNIGMEFDTRYMPNNQYGVFGSRFAYFKDHDLFVLNKKLFHHDNSNLVAFVNSEISQGTNDVGYIPFVDNGPPITSRGELDIDFIKKAGVKVPKGHYLALGDNYSTSADSRYFGFVPQENIKGVPEFIFWPPGSNFGLLKQPQYPLFTLPRIIVWCLAAIVFVIWGIISGKRHSLPLDIPK